MHNKNTIFAIVVSLIILLGLAVFYYSHRRSAERVAEEEAQRQLLLRQALKDLTAPRITASSTKNKAAVSAPNQPLVPKPVIQNLSTPEQRSTDAPIVPQGVLDTLTAPAKK